MVTALALAGVAWISHLLGIHSKERWTLAANVGEFLLLVATPLVLILGAGDYRGGFWGGYIGALLVIPPYARESRFASREQAERFNRTLHRLRWPYLVAGIAIMVLGLLQVAGQGMSWIAVGATYILIVAIRLRYHRTLSPVQ